MKLPFLRDLFKPQSLADAPVPGYGEPALAPIGSRAAPGTGNLWDEFQVWRETDKAKAALKNGLIGSPETIRKRLRQFQAAHVDQVILLNQAGKTSHADICDSLRLFANEVMPEFHAAESEHLQWKRAVLDQEITLTEIDTTPYDLYSHQNEDIVRESPAQLKARMAAKDAARTQKV